MLTEQEAEVTPDRWTSLVPPIFARCVDPEVSRYGLASPFFQDGFLYATDGQIAVRMPWVGEWAHAGEGRVPRMEDVFGMVNKPDGEPTPLPHVEAPACKTCHGAKTVERRKCEECEGTGEIDHDCDCERCTQDTEDCNECYGKGYFGPGECETCDGTGIGGGSDAVRIEEGCWLQRRFALLLAEFGAKVHLPEGRRPLDPIRFTAGEVEGVLMPMTPHGEAD